MLLQAIGAIANIILDPILIFGLFGAPRMGVRGAAVATVLGQVLSMTLSLLVFFLRDQDVRMDLKNSNQIYMPSPRFMQWACLLC